MAGSSVSARRARCGRPGGAGRLLANLDGTNIYMTLATLFLAQATNTI